MKMKMKVSNLFYFKLNIYTVTVLLFHVSQMKKLTFRITYTKKQFYRKRHIYVITTHKDIYSFSLLQLLTTKIKRQLTF